MFIHLYIVYVCFLATTTELSNYNRNCNGPARNIYYLTFYTEVCQPMIEDAILSLFWLFPPIIHCRLWTIQYTISSSIVLVPEFFFKQVHDNLTLQKVLWLMFKTRREDDMPLASQRHTPPVNLTWLL